jgi:hypothetical protein
MDTACRAILQLVAQGRLTPLDAERLLLAWNERRETAWVMACVAAIAVVGQLHAWVALSAPLAHIGHALSLVKQFLGETS